MKKLILLFISLLAVGAAFQSCDNTKTYAEMLEEERDGVNDFINKLLEVEKVPTLYRLGKFMNSYQGKYLLCDCSGLIKGILWGYPKHGKYGSNGVPDVNAHSLMFQWCNGVSSDMSSSKIQKGELLWLDGHCGVYLGNGNVVESSPKWENGIQITKLSQRKWLRHGKLLFIDYSANSNVSNSTRIDINKVVDDVINGKYGNGHENRRKQIEKLGLNYEEVRKLVNQKLKG